ncbi:MAG: RloB domain-containing protein [Bacteroides sp.]|nr:RloB domain-containing protein [Bacteroides sp.]
MGKRELAESAEESKYFASVHTATSEVEDESKEKQGTEHGTREMGILYPFIISGGKNTERFYFKHINDLTDYKFNIKPEYFADESNYTEVFPKRIREILSKNTDAKIYCVFDWDTIYADETCLKKHDAFVEEFVDEIKNGTVVICHSMPSIEYWFLLHFEENCTELLKDYSAVSMRLAPHIKPCFSDSAPKLKKLLKMEKYLKDSTWVKNLIDNGKLEKATKYAESNINAAQANDDLENQSFSYVYKIFKGG